MVLTKVCSEFVAVDSTFQVFKTIRLDHLLFHSSLCNLIHLHAYVANSSHFWMLTWKLSKKSHMWVGLCAFQCVLKKSYGCLVRENSSSHNSGLHNDSGHFWRIVMEWVHEPEDSEVVAQKYPCCWKHSDIKHRTDVTFKSSRALECSLNHFQINSGQGLLRKQLSSSHVGRWGFQASESNKDHAGRPGALA